MQFVADLLDERLDNSHSEPFAARRIEVRRQSTKRLATMVKPCG